MTPAYANLLIDRDTALRSKIPARQLVINKALDWLTPVEVETKGQHYDFYGANAEIFNLKGEEFILGGPADTGKTLACLSFLNSLCWEYPGSQNAIIRKEYSSMPGTVLQSFQTEVLKPNDGVEFYGGERHPGRYIYSNKSCIWIGGLDKASKALSSQRDVIYVNQAEELDLHEWEILKTRCSGRAGHMPFGMLMGDCNPAYPDHWIVQRAEVGSLKLLKSQHRDNPELFDPITGEITDGGKRRLAALETLSGTNKQRLFYGLWAQLEGAIYDVFERDRHVMPPFDIPKMYPRIVGVDPLGEYTSAVWVAYDPSKKVLVVYREYSQPFGETTAGHVRNLLRLSGYETDGRPTSNSENVFVWAGGGPTERQQRVDWAGAGIPLQAPDIGDVWIGIDKVYELLKDNRLFVFDDCMGLIHEISSYRRRVIDGRVTNEIANKGRYHLLDALRYAIAWLASPSEVVRIGRVTIPRIGDY